MMLGRGFHPPCSGDLPFRDVAPDPPVEREQLAVDRECRPMLRRVDPRLHVGEPLYAARRRACDGRWRPLPAERRRPPRRRRLALRYMSLTDFTCAQKTMRKIAKYRVASSRPLRGSDCTGGVLPPCTERSVRAGCCRARRCPWLRADDATRMGTYVDAGLSHPKPQQRCGGASDHRRPTTQSA